MYNNKKGKLIVGNSIRLERLNQIDSLKKKKKIWKILKKSLFNIFFYKFFIVHEWLPVVKFYRL